MLLIWSQMNADKVTIYIENDKNKTQKVINKTKNDGIEFLPNVTSSQKIKLLPYNGCKKGNISKVN
jgi:hypothetical protein